MKAIIHNTNDKYFFIKGMLMLGPDDEKKGMLSTL